MTENTTLRAVKRWLWPESESSLQNADAFTRLYEQTYLTVFRYVYGLSASSHQEAEDLTAETYARAWKYRQRFNGDEQAVLGWLLRIARNLAIDASRRRKVRDVDESANVELLLDPQVAPEIDVITREQIALLWQMLGTLASDVREMMVLRYMLGWQVRQMSSYLGVNENTISVTIRRTLKSLQREWPQAQEKDNE
ncbi:MAG TPA: sigma-70 family RNA polymerase sigma factor [Anaerolineales bacterium]|nr:sigma-70 family RNA polymerase sigma factor [Anaerolineales bacterium]